MFLIKLIPRYFIHSDTTVKVTVFLISLPDSSLFMSRNMTDFCILILYPATLLNPMRSSNSFLVTSFRIFYMRYHVIYTQ